MTHSTTQRHHLTHTTPTIHRELAESIINLNGIYVSITDYQFTLSTTQHHYDITTTISTVDDELSESFTNPADKIDEYYYLITINQSTLHTYRISLELVDRIVGIGKSFRHSGSTKKIEVFNGMNKNGGVETINTNKFLAIRWINLSISTLHEDETEDFAIVICVIYPNGNISIYYEKIPMEFGDSAGKLLISDGYDYATYNSSGLYIIKTSYSMIKTPESMIKSRTLVEFTPNTICSEQTFCETCINASSVSGKCYWCPVISKCSHGYDIHRPTWMFKSCYIKNTTNCEKLTASKYTENYEINSTEQTSISYPNISQKYFKNNTQTSEKSTTNLANFTTTKYELRTNKLPSSTSNDKILENSGISLPLYLIIPILAALAVIFLIIICALCLGVCKKKSKKRRKPNTLQISE
ncbi:Plexin domain-containing protein [Schistosoma japonicum]|uniref:Plexin domain-containing protein n=1 Tax=Schistosoma japonicum TaxID=6182 RepID=A0A4Z2DUJ4_SCHJA|nr:Plexin domain-containing protein [Schistosoma japonicum]